MKAYVNFGSLLISGQEHASMSRYLGKLRLSDVGTDKEMKTQISAYDGMRRLDGSAHARAGVMTTRMKIANLSHLRVTGQKQWRHECWEQRMNTVFYSERTHQQYQRAKKAPVGRWGDGWRGKV